MIMRTGGKLAILALTGAVIAFTVSDVNARSFGGGGHQLPAHQ